MEEAKSRADAFRKVVEHVRKLREDLEAERQAATDPLNLMRFFWLFGFSDWRSRLAESLRELTDWIEGSE